MDVFVAQAVLGLGWNKNKTKYAANKTHRKGNKNSKGKTCILITFEKAGEKPTSWSGVDGCC